MYVIVGLGNPGLRYAHTRHNMGFMTIDALAKKLGTKVDRKKFQSKVGEASLSGHKLLLAKPQVYMNRSGQAVREIVDFYKIPMSGLLIVYDDFDIDTGSIRIRPSGSAGTHNGMRSVVEHLGSSDFARIRIGIGEHEDGDAIGHVIGRISKQEKEPLQRAIDDAADAVISIIEDGIDRAMNTYNGHR